MFALVFLAALLVANGQELKVARSIKDVTGFHLYELDQMAEQNGCKSGKVSKQGVPGECDFTSGGFHIVCDSFSSYSDADAVCKQFGWREAEVNDSNSMHAAAVLRVCNGPFSKAWIQSFNGLTGEPCMVGDGSGSAMTGHADQLCESNYAMEQRRVLCQEVPTITSTTVSLTTWSVAQGATTSTTTIVTTHKKKPERGGRGRWPHNGNSDSTDFSFKINKPITACQQCPVGFCDQVCPFQYPTLRIVRTQVPYSQADQVCRRHGWQLAAVTAGTMADVTDLFAQCFGPIPLLIDIGQQRWLWIRSYNGVDAASCNAFDGSMVVYPMAVDVCNALASEEQVWVLCQTEGPNVAESDGGYAGRPFVTTTTTSSTVMKVYPSTTETQTVTVTKKCDKKDHHVS